ncbi:vWA domain-containing protein [Actinacidiphila acididurans]|uniref:VWA domain-containing protein n=1 Tax=Actinacidiphila acididurans TaxID=2784346 RepID=A0ABS2TZZ1_9ACTN|nr:VWA domain-containing protein [Actinacidiphila acididurans]MBM9508920.1 VWA domain-containing protein [Actinacidiphila acididurans]
MPAPSGGPYTLHVLGSSELADMKPVFDDAEKATGVKVDLTPTGSVTGAQSLLEGKTAGHYDAVWFASDDYLDLHPDVQRRLDGTLDIMSSPVVLGLRSSVVRRLGWTGKQVSWAQIATAAGQGKFTFAMTDPAKSFSGLATLIAAATAVGGHGAALQTEQIPSAQGALSGLFHAQGVKSDSSGWLADQYLADAQHPGPASVDGLIDYESVLLSIDTRLTAGSGSGSGNAAKGPAADPLTLVYPSDGTVRADYPFSLLAGAPPAAGDAFHRLVQYLRGPGVQQEIMRTTHRRPIVSSVRLAPELAGHQPYDLPFPRRLSTVDTLITRYADSMRRPGRTVYLLDTSGSMQGARMAELRQAVKALTGADPDPVDGFSRFDAQERVVFVPFSSGSGPPRTYDIPDKAPQQTFERINDYVGHLPVGGSTAMYDALASAYRTVARDPSAGTGWLDSVVLLTDGESNTGWGPAQFTSFYRGLPPGAPPVFTVLFGDARKAQLDRIAALTGGRTFDATKQPLNKVFEDLTAYQ